MKTSRDWFKIFSGILLLLIAANLLFLDYQFLQSTQKKPLPVATPAVSSNFGEELVVPAELADSATMTVDYQRIFESIKSATASLTLKVNTLSQTVNNLPSESESVAPSYAPSLIRESYIPLGNGSTNSTTWVDLPGVEAYVAPGNYGKIVSFYFEAALRIPTGNGQVLARLKNVTDNVPLVESEVTLQGSSGGLVSSGKIPVPTQTKLYRVQLRSSIGADVVLDNGRLKLFTQ